MGSENNYCNRMGIRGKLKVVDITKKKYNINF
jgi:hypothetical protein